MDSQDQYLYQTTSWVENNIDHISKRKFIKHHEIQSMMNRIAHDLRIDEPFLDDNEWDSTIGGFEDSPF
ncbi:hypothetical protein [Mangrovimonas futianensis]|uniref:hypothetical protein n=1 Tax=Mangrovimonas futianensis TaxID=2895523 RepID=UPI001E5D1A8A|nr:hypothetical protein [Mangrovimonas futianensis]MCF1421036.1 hypothetical protein [Mangrovimonas futianensis]